MPKRIPQCIALEFISIFTAAKSLLTKYFWEIKTKIGCYIVTYPINNSKLVVETRARIFHDTGTNRSLAPKKTSNLNHIDSTPVRINLTYIIRILRGICSMFN